jgi:hypothetical protein
MFFRWNLVGNVIIKGGLSTNDCNFLEFFYAFVVNTKTWFFFNPIEFQILHDLNSVLIKNFEWEILFKCIILYYFEIWWV